MAWRIEFSTEAEHDLELVFDHSVDSYLEFGESVAEALPHALRRVEEIRENAARLGIAPHRGTLRDSMLPGLRLGGAAKARPVALPERQLGRWRDLGRSARSRAGRG